MCIAVKQSTKAKFIIIGSGFGGMMTAIRLRQIGETDIIILERDCDGSTNHAYAKSNKTYTHKIL